MYFFSPMLYFFNFSLYIWKNNFILGKNFKFSFLNLEVSLFFQSSSFHFEAISMSLFLFWVFFWLYYEWLLLLFCCFVMSLSLLKKNKWTPCVCARRNAKAIKCMLVKLMMFGVFIHCLLSKLCHNEIIKYFFAPHAKRCM